MSKRTTEGNVVARSYVAGVLAWLVPGAGHWFVGCRARAVILFVTVGLTFWSGIALGGVKSTVDLEHNRLWFIPQSFAGAHALIALNWGRSLPDFDPKHPSVEALRRYSFWPEIDLGQVYTGVAGLLNLLCVLDVLARAQHPGGVVKTASSARTQGGPT